MAISASQIVQINPRLLQPGGVDLELNGLLLARDETIPTDALVLPFGDPDGVGGYFGVSSEIYRLANIYFLGFANSQIKPRAMYVARRVDEDAAPFLRGGEVSRTVAQLRALTTGTLTLTLGTHTEEITGLSFAAIQSYSDAAQALQTAIRSKTAGGAAWAGATVAYSSLFKAYTITGGAAGAGQQAEHATGSAADVLGLTLEGGAVISQGMNAMTEAENMEAVLGKTGNWVTFTTAWKPEKDAMTAFAQWSGGKGVQYLYVGWDDDRNLLQPNNTNTIAAAFADLELSGAALEWQSPDYAAFVLGIGASIDYNQRQGAISTAFKSQDGLAANVINSTDAVNLLAKNVNFYGNYATRNDNFVFHYPGSMFGRWRYIDTYLNAIWFNNALQAALMAGLTQTPRVPYTEAGYALVRSWIQDPVNRGLNNGVIDPGLKLSEAQKAQINREAGLNIVPYIEQDGYYVQVLDPGANVRITRDSPIVNIWYAYGGSVNRLVVTSTALV